MIKKKITTFAAAALAACSIGATAFATTYGVPKYSFGPTTLYEGGAAKSTTTAKKEDNLSAWIDVEYGLSSGEAYATFRVYNSNSSVATPPSDTWVNGEKYIDYYSGEGKKEKYYFLRYYMEPQKVDSIYIGGIWAP